MAPTEKAEAALNARIERIQATLREAKSDHARQFLVQSLVACLGIGEGLGDYVKMIGQYARGRHGELKQAHDMLTAQHADALKAGQELLERFKANPTDQAIRKEIERAQKNMETIQKTLKRGANALQRDLAPSMAMIDQLALSIRRLAEADGIDAIKRATRMVIAHTGELYRTQPSLPAKNIVDAASWEDSALSDIDRATDFHEAFARGAYQAMLALDLMTMAVSPTPPPTATEATTRATESVGARLKAITARLAAG